MQPGDKVWWYRPMGRQRKYYGAGGWEEVELVRVGGADCWVKQADGSVRRTRGENVQARRPTGGSPAGAVARRPGLPTLYFRTGGEGRRRVR